MFLLLLIGEKSQALCYVSNRHGSFSRISHYFRKNFNSFMQKNPKVNRVDFCVQNTVQLTAG